MYEIVSKFYGTAGRHYINKLIEEYEADNFKKLKEKYDEVFKKIEEKTSNDILSYVSSVAVVTLADIIIGEIIFNENEEKSFEMAQEILNNLDKSQDIDIIDKAYEYIISWIVSNHKSFDLYKEPISSNWNKGKVVTKFNQIDDLVENERTKKSFGIFDKGIYYVFRDVLEDKLEDKKYSYRKIITEFAKRGYISPTRDKEGNISTTTVQKKYRNVNTRMFAFPVETINKFLEGKELEDAKKELIATANMCDSYEEFEARKNLKVEGLLESDDIKDETIDLELQKEIEELEKLDKIEENNVQDDKNNIK